MPVKLHHTIVEKAIACCGAALFGGLSVEAQEPVAARVPVEPPAELAELRDGFERAVMARSAPAREKFASALQELAQARGEGGDYEGAIRARDRRLEILNLSDPVATAPAARGEIVVDLPSGKRAGSGLKYDAEGKKIVGFSKSNQSILWDISETVSGVYSIMVTYSCGEPEKIDGEQPLPTGGTFTLEEDTSLAAVDSPPLQHTVSPSGGWNKLVTRNIGKLTLAGGRLPLKLLVSSSGEGGLMHLYGISLVPIASNSAEDAATPDDFPAELASLRAMFRSAILPKTTPLVAAYGMRLRAMLQAFTDANDLEGAYEVQKEFTAAESLSKDPTRIFESPPEP